MKLFASDTKKAWHSISSEIYFKKGWQRSS